MNYNTVKPSKFKIDQIVSGDKSVQEPAKKFFLERLADSDKYIPALQSDEKLKTFIIDQVS